MSVTPFARTVKPTAIVGGYIRLTTKRYRGSDPVEEPVYVRADTVQVVEAHYSDRNDTLIGATLTLQGGGRVYARQSVESVLALLEEAGRADR